MFWSCIICMLTISAKILIVFWARNNGRTEAKGDKHTYNIYSSDIILYRNMAATNAMIFSLDYILYSKLLRSLYKPLFHTLYWLDGCCLVRGCDIIWRRPHVVSQNKKTWQTFRLLETSKRGNDYLVFDINYLLSKRCLDLACFVYPPFRQNF